MKIICIILLTNYLLGNSLDKAFYIAGQNKSELKKAIKLVPKEQLAGMEWIIRHMPEEHLKILDADFLIKNSDLAYKMKNNAPWGNKIPEEIFLNYVLPYSNLNERIDNWRPEFQEKFYPLVKDLESSYQATILLNKKIYDIVGVKYSTKRPKADQSPFESIESGMASCTGLSILLVDACRSVGIPARFVGTPLWYNNSGNHSWVEIWDKEWHFTGAAEPTGDRLNEAWFLSHANKATEGDMDYGIFAATWEDTELYFPMTWLPNEKSYNAIDVTTRYAISIIDQEKIPIRVRVLDSTGKRTEVRVAIIGIDGHIKEGISKGDSFDANDHLTFMLPKGNTFDIQVSNITRTINVINEELIEIKIQGD